MEQQVLQAINQAQTALQALEIECSSEVTYKVVDNTVMENYSLTLNGKEIYSKSFPRPESPEVFKAQVEETRDKAVQQHEEEIAKVEAIVAAMDEATTKTKQTKN